MPPVKISLGSMTDGVSTRPMPQRGPATMREAINTMMRRSRGVEKRPGTTLVEAQGGLGFDLDVTNPIGDKFFHWIDRSEFEKFLVVIDPDNTGIDRIEIFNLVARGTGLGGAENERAGEKMVVFTVLSGLDDPLDYLELGDIAARHRYRCLTVADTTIIANRNIEAALTGAAINYTNGNGTTLIRDVATVANNKPSWNSFPQPPTGTASAGDIDDADIFYARDDDLGWPAGWYRASSTTQPPWYTRIRTEGANSLVNHETWPVQLKFDGQEFELSFPAWNERYSGDSFTNPGPQTASGPSSPHRIRDLCFFQSRLWFGSYEFLDSSQTGDIFNLWNNSGVGITDTDPINVSFQSDAVTTVDWLVPFDGGIVAFTRGSRQFAVMSQGAMAPSTVSILPTTSYPTVDYCPPTKLANQLYFMGERNGSMILYEYVFQSDRSANVATDATGEIEGYIPSRVWTVQESALNDMLFCLSTQAVRNIYVNQMKWDEGQNLQRAWMKWDRNRTIAAIRVMGTVLYVVANRTGGKLYLETVNIDLPVNDDSDETPVTVNGYSGSGDMGFNICLDAKLTTSGMYSSIDNTTTWTVPFEDTTINRVVLGQMFDCDYEWPPSSGTFHSQRWKGKTLKPTSEGGNLTIMVGDGSTTIVAAGKYDTNAYGSVAKVWIGINYDMRLTLNEQFYRDQQGATVSGKVQLKSLMLKLIGTGDLKVEITPQGRDTITFPYVNEQIGQFSLSEGQTDPEYDEFNLPCMGRAYDTQIEIVNDSVYPCRIVGGEFRAGFVPSTSNPTRR